MRAIMFDFKDGNGPVPAHRHHNGGGWVADTAEVSGNAKVSGNARVFGNAEVSGNAEVFGNARVFGNAKVSGNAWVSGNARVFGDAWVSSNAEVSGNASCTIAPVVITGIQWNVTILNSHIQIGCECHSTENWAKFKNSRIKLMDEGATKFWSEHKDLILGLAAIHQKKIQKNK